MNEHSSNPNPSPERGTKFRSVNQIGQEGAKTESERHRLESLRFGRRVIFDRQLSSKDLLQSHLDTLHEQDSQRRHTKSLGRLTDREYIDRRKRD